MSRFATRGWTHWHHLYNPRQLLTIGLFQELAAQTAKTQTDRRGASPRHWTDGGLVLTIVHDGIRMRQMKRDQHIFYNQALNTVVNYAMPAFMPLLHTTWYFTFPRAKYVIRFSHYSPWTPEQRPTPPTSGSPIPPTPTPSIMRNSPNSFWPGTKSACPSSFPSGMPTASAPWP